MTDKEIDSHRTDEIVCPYCSYEFQDSWEYADSNSETLVFCHGCEKEFTLNVDHETVYSTKKIK